MTAAEEMVKRAEKALERYEAKMLKSASYMRKPKYRESIPGCLHRLGLDIGTAGFLNNPGNNEHTNNAI